MNFFNLDLHIGVIGDLKFIFEQMGHSVTSWSISRHTWVINAKRTPVEVVNAETWRSIDEAMCEKFYLRYKDELAKYDAFIVTHTPCFSMLFARWKKPIICVASTRYEQPFTDDLKAWKRFDGFLREAIDNGQLIPIANNAYDADYAGLFTQREWEVIPSLCEYTGSAYTGKHENVLYCSKFYPIPNVPSLIDKKECYRPSFAQRLMRRIGFPYGRYGYLWQDLADFKGAVWIPYNVSIMSIFEMYMAGIPMFFPTSDFIMDLYEQNYARGVLSELSFRQVLGLRPSSRLEIDQTDPNDFLDFDSVRDWIQKSDFYDPNNLAHLLYFSSFDDLREQVQNANFVETSCKMVEHNRYRKDAVYNQWRSVLSNL